MKLRTLTYVTFRTVLSKILYQNFTHFRGKFEILKLRYQKELLFLLMPFMTTKMKLTQNELYPKLSNFKISNFPRKCVKFCDKILMKQCENF